MAVWSIQFSLQLTVEKNQILIKSFKSGHIDSMVLFKEVFVLSQFYEIKVHQMAFPQCFLITLWVGDILVQKPEE